MNMRFYQCDICGKVIAVITDTDIPTICCGQTMRELIPNTTDGAAEKHVPVYYSEGDTVTIHVGSAPHPSADNHYIGWIALRTDGGFQFRELHPGDLPTTVFTVDPADPVRAVYAFCNLHGLWLSETENGSVF